jgi:hypothetical protein
MSETKMEFEDFLSDCGIENVFALVDFLSELPEDLEMMSTEMAEENYRRYSEDLDLIFNNTEIE